MMDIDCYNNEEEGEVHRFIYSNDIKEGIKCSCGKEEYKKENEK